MGTVEVAIERGGEGCERVVALKRLLPEGARDARHKEMFLREARLAALLAHPNVVHAFAFGELYGELFMAMEYVEGEPLSRVLRSGPQNDTGLPPTLVAHILAQVCDGLHAAHELRDSGSQGQPLNVVHRDVSPHNILVGYEGHVKLLDFGVAKFEAGGNETRTGEVKGKMAYMSPEQALGERLDRRSDLFSIGAVLFECLTGRRMWGSGTDLEVMRKLALESPPRLDQSIPNAPHALVDLHARLVERDPAMRPATAQVVADELRAFASTSVPPPDADAVRDWMRSLFGAQADARKALLTESLERAAPARVAELQRSLDPETALGRPTSTEPVIVQGPASGPRLLTGSRKRIAAAALLSSLGAVAVAFAARRPPAVDHPTVEGAAVARSAATSPTSTSTSTSTSTATPTATPNLPTSPSPHALSGPAATDSPSRPSPVPALYSSTSSVSAARPRPPTRVIAPVPSNSADSGPSRLPDVDPTPF